MHIRCLACLALATALHLAAQTATPTDALSTLRASAHLVVVDVVVEDAHGNPVKDLKHSDFTLTEAKAEQPLRSFEEHLAPPLTRLVSVPAMPPGVFTNLAPTPVNSAVNILLLDLLNTPMQDQTYVRAQLAKYLQTAKPDTRIAIFSLTDHLRMLQTFTTDPEQLLRVIEKVKVKSSPLLPNPGGTGPPTQTSDQLSSLTGAQSGELQIDPAIVANLVDFEAENNSFQTTSRALDTLSAMNQLARYLTGIPGRKNVL